MITPDSGASTALASNARAAHWLVELDFASGTIYFTTNAIDFPPINGHVYKGLGALVSVSVVSESEDPNQTQATLGFSIGTDKALLAACIGPAESYRGKPARLYQQFTDGTHQPAGAPEQRFTGVMEPTSIKWTRDKDTGVMNARLEMPLSRTGLPRSRNALGLRLTHAQQQERFPGDRGLEYLQGLVEKPSLWLSKKFQQVE